MGAPPGFARMAGLVALVAFVIHAPSLGYDFTYLDDDQLILGRAAFLSDARSALRAFAEPYFAGSSSYYRPLVTASFVFDSQWNGVRPLAYHLTNVLLHVGISVLVLWLLLALRVGPLPARIAAMLFAVHPLQTASVAWIVGRNDLLLTAFVLGAAACLLAEAAAPRALTKLGHFACLTAALFSKETALLAPLWFVVFAWAAGELGVVKQRWAWASWTFAFALYFTARVAALGGLFSLNALSAARIGTGPLDSARVLLADLGKLLAPMSLQVLSAPADVPVWPGLTAVLILVATGVGVRGLRPAIVVLAALLTALPALAGLYGSRSIVLENRLYLAVFGVILLGAEILRALGANERTRPALTIAPAALLIAFAVVTTRYSPSFANASAFAQAAIAASPNSGVAVNLMRRAAMRNEAQPSQRADP